MKIDDKAFRDLKVYRSIEKELIGGNVFHANLFCSPDRSTNELISFQIAKLIVCEDKKGCGTCSTCVKTQSESNPDVMSFGKNSRVNVADVEKIIAEQTLKPMISNCKLYIINNIDNATIQAQNKLLKVLEEPNKDVYFILNAVNLDAVLPTIKSRCKIKNVDGLSYEQASGLFGEKLSPMLYSQSGGYLGKMEELSKGGDFEKMTTLCEEIVFEMKNSKQVLNYSSQMAQSKQNFVTKLSLIESLYRSILSNLIEIDEEVDSQILDKIEKVKNEFTVEAIVEIINAIEFAKRQFDANVNLGMISDGLLMKILEVKYLCKQK